MQYSPVYIKCCLTLWKINSQNFTLYWWLRFFQNIGCKHSLTDKCVTHQVVEEDVYIIVLYIDDVLVIRRESELDNIREVFIEEFQLFTMKTSSTLF